MNVFKLIPVAVLAVIVIVSFIKCIQIVPNKITRIVERLGKYKCTLDAGFHFLIPFIEKVRYEQTLKEQAIDVPAQDCFTKDNVRVKIDGILYLQVFDPVKASYGIVNYKYATILLAQTTMRSVVGVLDLDDTFEAREQINAKVVKALDEASDPWGVKVTRYEIQNITVSPSIMDAMENQMKAEREKRAVIARSVGEMETMINRSRASYEEAKNVSEGEKEKMINIAEGQAREIVAVAQATAEGIRKVAASTELQGGMDAAKLSISDKWIEALKNLQNNSKVVMTADLTNIKEMTTKAAKEMLDTIGN
ncbi:MAG: paraslipin [Treponema sp.]|nr:MAG: paraslipin [Treponema sp.]